MWGIRAVPSQNSAATPGLNVSTSTDNGETWSAAESVFQNHESQLQMFGTSGYSGIQALDSNRAVVSFDNCKPANSTSSDFPTECVVPNWQAQNFDPPSLPLSGWQWGQATKIWMKYLDVLTDNTAKLDLYSMYRDGKLLIDASTTFPLTSPIATTHPETRAAAAFDGSTDYHSSAMMRNVGSTTPVFAIKFNDCPTQPCSKKLTRLGISLHKGFTSSATIETSNNSGSTWQKYSVSGTTLTPATTATPITGNHIALNYFNFSTPVTANMVRILPAVSAACDKSTGGIGAGNVSCASINEFELYSTTNSFENEAIPHPPRGFVTQGWVYVNDDSSNRNVGSRRYLVLDDHSTTQQTKATLNVSATSATKTLSFAFRGVQATNPFIFSINGKNGSTPYNSFRFYIAADGSIKKYTHATNTWWGPTTAGPGTVPVSSWTRIKIVATAGGAASIYINDNPTAVFSGTAQSEPGATVLSGIEFASSGVSTTNDTYTVDEVSFE